MRGTGAAVLVAALLAQGCYHATIETGATPSTETIDEPWASSFIFGLVPPKTVSTQAKCVSGVARVETQHSFLNLLVGGITFGIYTPIAIKVTCAAKKTADTGEGTVIRVGLSAATYDDAMQQAVRRSLKEGRPVDVEF